MPRNVGQPFPASPSARHYVHAFALRYQGPLSMVGSLVYGLMMPYQSNGFLDGVAQYAALVVGGGIS